jgi:hypothetical protein
MAKGAENQHPEMVRGISWYRSSGYHIDGGMIRLTPGATLEPYDPWEEWREAADEDRPYKRLLRLSQQLHPGRFGAPLPRRERQLLEQWVRRNGLLGILRHETLEATLAPRWRDEDEDQPLSTNVHRGVRVFVPVQRRYQLRGDGWRTSLERPSAARTTDPALEGQLASAKQMGAPWLPCEVLRRRLPDAKLERVPLGEHYDEYFPDVPRAEKETYPYPSFGSDEFWPSYAESVRSFIAAARYLAAPLEALDRLRGEVAIDSEEQVLAWRAVDRVNAIASTAQLSGGLMENGGFGVGWWSPSLLGTFAVMLLSDLSAGHQVKRCPNCGVFFVSKNRRTSYCSSTCRYAFQKREWRKAKTEKRGGGGAKGNDAE